MKNDLIEKKLKGQGATLVGFADLSEIDTEQRRGYQYGISIAIALNPEIVDNILTGPHMEYYNEYKNVSQKLKDLSQYIEQFISCRLGLDWKISCFGIRFSPKIHHILRK